MFNISTVSIGIVGLGYVGLPLAVEFGKICPTFGLDINENRIRELLSGVDRTLEITSDELDEASMLHYTSCPDDLIHCNVYIVTVPTPVDDYKRPDFRPLINASTTVGRLLTVGDVVIYESTVYPGATEEICIPILMQQSKLRFNVDFFVGYSPERINPGDKEHRVTNICKITAGSTPEVAQYIDDLYRLIIIAGTHKTSSIRVAEAAKVIENIQRDVNIALINELALLFSKIGIDTQEVLLAASSKWNFLDFQPGLVGGHCIGVDPYYLTYKAQTIGYHPEMILAGRRINDGMGAYVALRVVKLMAQKGIQLVNAKILVMGLAFKENCPDLRNTRIIEIIREFHDYKVVKVDVYDPWVNCQEAIREYGIEPVQEPKLGDYDAIILAVAHRQFQELGASRIRQLGKRNAVLFDVKYILPASEVDGRL